MESLGWLGQYRLVKHYKDRKEVKEIKNAIMNTGLNLMVDAMQGKDIIKITHVALGDDSTPVTFADTQLGNERFRKSFSTQSRQATGELLSKVVIQDNEANFRIREIGIFGGNQATTTKDSGVLISRIIVDEDHNTSEPFSITIERTDAIRRL